MRGSDHHSSKSLIHWVCAAQDCGAEVRRYYHLFKVATAGKAAGNYPGDLTPYSLKMNRANLEHSLGEAKGEKRFQFEGHGYFVVDESPAGRWITRAVTLRESWSR